jgi:hypothetical protein
MLIVSVGLVLLVLLIVVLRKGLGSDSHLLRTALGMDISDSLPPPEVLDRIFDPADLAFIASEHSPSLLRLIAEERQRLALSWLAQIKREALGTLARHRRVVRHLANLRPAVELRLALHAFSFYAVYFIVSALVRLYGAFETHAVIQQALRLCERLARLHSEMLADVAFEQEPALS